MKEIYPAANRKAEEYSLNEEILKGYLGLAKSGDNLKKILVPKTGKLTQKLIFFFH